jgi:hypothetical protein
MNIARIIFGVLYLAGAVFNTIWPILNGVESYHDFFDATWIPFYLEAWEAIVIPNMLLFIILTVIFEVALGVLFIINRKYLKIALILGIIFCLGVMPVMVEAIYTNLPLAIIQAFLLWKETRRTSTIRNN